MKVCDSHFANYKIVSSTWSLNILISYFFKKLHEYNNTFGELYSPCDQLFLYNIAINPVKAQSKVMNASRISCSIYFHINEDLSIKL